MPPASLALVCSHNPVLAFGLAPPYSDLIDRASVPDLVSAAVGLSRLSTEVQRGIFILAFTSCTSEPDLFVSYQKEVASTGTIYSFLGINTKSNLC